MKPLHLVAIALLLFCVLAEVGRELCFKHVASTGTATHESYLLRVLRTPLIWVGILLWVFEAVAWVAVLGSMPLSVAFPIATLSYAMVPMAGVTMLGERLGRAQVTGAALVALGVAVIAWGHK